MSNAQVIYEIKQLIEKLEQTHRKIEQMVGKLQQLLDKYGTGVEEHTVIKELEDVTSALEELSANIGSRERPQSGSLIARVGSESDPSTLIGKMKQMVDKLQELLEKYGTGVEEHTVIKELEDVTRALEGVLHADLLDLAGRIGDVATPNSLVERINDLSENRIGRVDKEGTLNYLMNKLSSIVVADKYIDVIQQSVGEGYNIWGLCIVGGKLYVVAWKEDSVRVLVCDKYSLEVLKEVAVDKLIVDICWDGTNFWVLYSEFIGDDVWEDYLGKINLDTGEVYDSFQVYRGSDDYACSVTCDGRYLYAAFEISCRVSCYDFNGNLVYSFYPTSPPSEVYGITCYGNDLLVLIYVRHGFPRTQIHVFSKRGVWKGEIKIPAGLFLWGIDYDSETGDIYSAGYTDELMIVLKRRGFIDVKGVDEILQQLQNRLNVNLSTRASETTLSSILNRLNVDLSSRASESTLSSILNRLNVELSSRASESTLSSILSRFNVSLSTRASETTLSSILNRLNVDLSTRASESTLSELSSRFSPVSSTGSSTTGNVTVTLDTGGRPFLEVYYNVSGSAMLYVSGSADGTNWYTTDTVFVPDAGSGSLMYMNAFRYVRVTCSSTGASVTVVVVASR